MKLHQSTTFTDATTDRMAIVSHEPYGFEVIFGRKDRAGEIVVRHFDSSRTYKTIGRAVSAAMRWTR